MHSLIDLTGIGEIAAAYCSGRLTAQEAISVAYLRGCSAQNNKQNGAMLATSIDESRLNSILEQYSGKLVIGCYNSADSFTVSGELDEIMKLKSILDAEDIFNRLINTFGNAYHSQHMIAVGAEYHASILESCKSLHKSRAVYSDIKMYSSVTGSSLSASSLPADYWQINLQSPVHFRQGLIAILESTPIDLIVELGPHSALKGPVKSVSRSALGNSGTGYLPTLLRNSNGTTDVLNAAGNLWLMNVPLDIAAINCQSDESSKEEKIPKASVITNLPRYQWQYDSTLLLENRWTQEWRLRQHPRHDILGSRIPGSTGNTPIWRNVLKLKDLPWIADHQVFPIMSLIDFR